MIDEDEEIKDEHVTINGKSSPLLYNYFDQTKKEEEVDEKKPITLFNVEGDTKHHTPYKTQDASDTTQSLDKSSTVLDRYNSDKPICDKFKIKLRTACGQTTDLLIRPSYKIEKITKKFLKYREKNSSCRNVCCTSTDISSNATHSKFKLLFDGELLRHDMTILDLEIDCGEVIDVHIVDNPT